MIWRVERRELFVALRSARRGRSGPLTVAHVPGDPTEPPRVAFAVGRKVGGAVARNRVRRRLCALVRDPDLPLPAGAYLIGAAPAARDATFAQLRRDLGAAVARSTGSSGSAAPA
ncbi:MAG: ribonuclease P protein component [Acidimicrobiales bacterium]